MELINALLLEQAWHKHPQTKEWLQQWMRIVEAATWHSIIDVRKTYPSADGVSLRSGLVITVFNVKGRRFRLLTEIQYDSQEVVVIDLLTHAEYDKQKWK